MAQQKVVEDLEPLLVQLGSIDDWFSVVRVRDAWSLTGTTRTKAIDFRYQINMHNARRRAKTWLCSARV